MKNMTLGEALQMVDAGRFDELNIWGWPCENWLQILRRQHEYLNPKKIGIILKNGVKLIVEGDASDFFSEWNAAVRPGAKFRSSGYSIALDEVAFACDAAKGVLWQD